MKLSIIIPTYNEAETVPSLLRYLKEHTSESSEIMVVDGGSHDQTVEKICEMDVICFESAQKGRAAQMNAGAGRARGDILYFVHADSYPPSGFEEDIHRAVAEGYRAGSYRSQFDSDHPLLKVNSFMTRFDRLMCRGGDQTLFITRALFEQLGGYRNDYLIMEDFELIERIQSTADFKIIPDDVIVSARKYEENSYLHVQLANLFVFLMYRWGCSQEQMVHAYRQMIQQCKF